MKGMRIFYLISVENPEGRKLPGSPRRRCEYNIKINIKEIRFEIVGCVHLA
jgi:hypothetical protein